MTTQSATITVSIPHDYAVRLGVAQIRELTVGPEISQADRDELARRIDRDSRLSLGSHIARHLAGAADIAAIAAAYRAALVEAAEEAKASKLAAVAELADVLAARRTAPHTETAWIHERESGSASWTRTTPAYVSGADKSDLAPLAREQWDAWLAELEAANRAAYAAALALARQEAEAKVAAREAREKALAAIVREAGTPNQVGRLTAGLLSEHEQLLIAKKVAFAPLAAHRHKAYVDAYDLRDATEASENEWDALQTIETAARASGMEATCTLMCRPAEYNVAPRHFVLVTLAYRGLTLSRAYEFDI